MKKQLKEFMKQLSSHLLMLSWFTAAILTLFMFIQYYLKINFLFPSLLMGSFALFLVCCGKDVVSSKDKFKFVSGVNFVLAITAIFTGFIFLFIPMLFTNNVFRLLITGLCLVCFLVLCMNEGTNAALLDIYDRDFYRKDLSKREDGDAQIGTDINTKKPVILPYTDRFLHMLILGPTGCGKTSQIITPMIYDDIRGEKVGIICLEPKGDLAEQVFALGKMYGRKTTYFNPILKDCPYFNPLMGDETDVTENLVTTFKMLNPDSSTFFQNQSEQLVRRATRVIKCLFKDDATLIQFDRLINNTNGDGMRWIKQFQKLPCKNDREKQDHDAIADWFLQDYFNKDRGGTKTYEHCSDVRAQISKLISNKYLNRVLNPEKGSELSPDEYIDFDRVLANKEVLAISSAQGDLRDLGRFLGFFLILQLQSAVFRRPGNVDTRPGCVLYIDEFQVYSNSGFSDMLTQGRSYRVASVLATQNRALIGMNSGKNAKSFLDLVSTNARNVVVFPGMNADDATYYSKQFGEDLVSKIDTKYSKKVGPFGVGGTITSESFGEVEKRESRFTSTDITYRKFKEVIYAIIQDNTLQRPGVSRVNFIPADVYKKITDFLKVYNAEQMIERDDEEEVFEIIHNEPPSYEEDFDLDDEGDAYFPSGEVDFDEEEVDDII